MALIKKDDHVEVQNTATLNGAKGIVKEVVKSRSFFKDIVLLEGRTFPLAFQKTELKLIEE